MAYMLSQASPTLPNTDWCQEFMGIGLGDQGLADTWCLANPTNFTDVTTLTTWVDGTWYGAEMTQTVQDVTDMDSAQIAAFYDFTTVGSFGNWLQQSILGIYNKYECEEEPLVVDGGESQYAKNCTSWYLARTQWGSSGITLDPPATSTDSAEATWYFPVDDAIPDTPVNYYSLVNWNIPNFPETSPEYYAYGRSTTQGRAATPALTVE